MWQHQVYHLSQSDFLKWEQQQKYIDSGGMSALIWKANVICKMRGILSATALWSEGGVLAMSYQGDWTQVMFVWLRSKDHPLP